MDAVGDAVTVTDLTDAIAIVLHDALQDRLLSMDQAETITAQIAHECETRITAFDVRAFVTRAFKG